MANKKTSSKENTKKTASTKKTTSTAKKATTKKATVKNTTKKVETKKAAPKKAATKTTTKTVKTEPKKVETVEVKTVEKVQPKKVAKNFNIIEWLKENYVIVGLLLVAILLVANIIIVSIGHKAKLVDGKEIIASIDGTNFTAEELFDKLKESYGNDALLSLVDEYIVEKDLTNDEKLEAKEKAQTDVDGIREQYETYGYKWEEVLTQYGYANEEELLNEFTLSTEKEIVAKKYLKEQLTEEEIETYYNENVFGSYTAKHILISPETTDEMTDDEVAAAEEAARVKAVEVIEKLNNGSDWVTLVTEYSDDEGSVEDEGLVENFTKGDVVDEFWDATEKLEDGKYSTEPVKSSYGYHVVYRVSYKEKDSLKSMKDELIEEIITNQLNEDANLYTNTWMSIRNNYKFEINDTIIKNAYESTKSE